MSQELGITVDKDQNPSEWYTQVVKKAGLAKYAEVKGCMIIKPYGMKLWDSIKENFDEKITETGVEIYYRTPNPSTRWAFRPLGFDPLLAKSSDTDSVRTRQEACAVPRNYPVETLGVGHSENTPVETALPTGTTVFLQSAFVEGTSTGCQTRSDNVLEAGSPTLSERTCASRAG